MQLHRFVTLVALLVVAGVLGAANVWVCAVRSTIPIELNSRVTKKEVRREKHPGRDDVLLIGLDDNRLIQVDRLVFDHVEQGDVLRKQSWQRRLTTKMTSIELEWSDDFTGMVRTVPLILLVLAVTAGSVQFIAIVPDDAAREDAKTLS